MDDIIAALELKTYADNVFLGIPINIYSHILAVAVILLALAVLLHMG